ncbi:MAG: helix-turn-helix domain-containing protein [Spirochaetaceae bacterium]|nr:helix-turn-helix domain-containing protein [Spirochaetia bacterium]MCF7951450.1 helix-turn-helix domain-containing protein [Spirochaetaceae bacterium]
MHDESVKAKPLWKFQDVANHFNVPVQTVRYWNSLGRLPSIKIGHSVRFYPEEIEQFIKTHHRDPVNEGGHK